MGFPPVHCFDEFKETDVRRLLGNTMHVAVVGIMQSVLLAMRRQ